MDPCMTILLNRCSIFRFCHRLWLGALFVLIGISLVFVVICPAAVDSDMQKPNKSGKYPASLIIKTRTATTYKKGLSVFTLVGNYFNFTEKRVADGQMHALDPGVNYKKTNFVLYGEYGLTDDFQFGIGVPYAFRKFKNDSAGIDQDTNGLGDMLVYGKYRLVRETRSRPAVAMDLWVKLPTGDKGDGLGNDEVNVKIAAEFSKRFNDISVHLNPEYTFTGGDKSTLGAAADNIFSCNLGAMYHLSPKVLPSIELNGLWWGDLGHEIDMGVGVLFFLRKNVSLKLGIAVPLNIDMPWGTDWVPWAKLATWF